MDAKDGKRRRGGTVTLIAGAAVLGVVAGACGGFLVQADREPTKLPPLSQPTLKQAKGEGPGKLPAAQDHQVKADGDLRKLLLKKPRGASDPHIPVGDDGWFDLAEYADTYTKPGGAFKELLDDEFRRGAVVVWNEGTKYTVEIRLIQFRQEETLAAAAEASGGYYWAADKDHTDSWPIPGTGDGMAYVHHDPDREPGYLDEYDAEAHAWRGDIVMEVWITGTSPIPKSKIMDLAKRQMERL